MCYHRISERKHQSFIRLFFLSLMINCGAHLDSQWVGVGGGGGGWVDSISDG